MQASAAMFLKSLATTMLFFSYGVNCNNVQHDGGIGQKTMAVCVQKRLAIHVLVAVQ